MRQLWVETIYRYIYWVTETKTLKKGLKIKNGLIRPISGLQNTQNSKKSLSWLQNLCLKTILHHFDIFLECLNVILCSIIIIRTYFQNFSLFQVWSANYGPFRYINCLSWAESNPSNVIMAIIGSNSHYGSKWCNGSKVFDKKGLKIKRCIKTPQIWSVKYTKFDNFSKKHVSMVDLMPRLCFVSRLTF